MSSYPTLTPRVIGQAEKTLNAILARHLDGTGLTEPQWVILTLAVTGGGSFGRGEFARQVAGALKIGAAAAADQIGHLVATGHLGLSGDGGTVTVAQAGHRVHAQITTATGEIVQRMWRDLPAGDLATAGRVLTIITERANAELAG
jgi:hypothetical protein